jgi:uncharacterized protein (DUF433 family)
MVRQEIGKYLVVDSRICFGKLTFAGTRVPVSTVLTFMSMGYTVDDVLADWKQLTREAVQEALKLAAVALEDKEVVKRAAAALAAHDAADARAE